MPCRDDYPREDPGTREQLDLVTRLLCEVVTANPDILPRGSDDLRRWWRRHETADRRRREAEARRAESERSGDQRRLRQIEAEAASIRRRLGGE